MSVAGSTLKSKYMKENLKCPVCKRTDCIHILWVPLGHGRYVKHICVRCKIVFPFGSNKFGDITDVSQIKKVGRFEIDRFADEGKDAISPQDHPDYQPDLFCAECGKDITNEGRMTDNKGSHCVPSCK